MKKESSENFNNSTLLTAAVNEMLKIANDKDIEPNDLGFIGLMLIKTAFLHLENKSERLGMWAYVAKELKKDIEEIPEKVH